MPARDEMWIDDMIQAANEALRFVSSRRRLDLDEDRMLTLALAKLIENIGEAAANISPETKSTMPGIPWPTIVQMRNRLVHAYFTINHDILWDTVTISLPELLKELAVNIGDE